jgi:hypothetical protein
VLQRATTTTQRVVVTAAAPPEAEGTDSGSDARISARISKFREAFVGPAPPGYRAAAVCLYDFDEQDGRVVTPTAAAAREAGATGAAASGVARWRRCVHVLLVHEDKGWSFPGGKKSYRDRDAPATAARELEEETHGLLPAARTLHALTTAPQVFYGGGGMQLFLVRLRRGAAADALIGAHAAAVAGACVLGWSGSELLLSPVARVGASFFCVCLARRRWV